MQFVIKSLKSACLSVTATIMLAGAGSVQAGVIFSGTAPAPGSFSNVRFLSTQSGVDLGPDTTVTGRAGNTPYLVDFTANELLIASDQPALGGAPAIPPSLRATDGVLHGLDIGVRNSAFTLFYYNLRLDTVPRNPAGRFADILVTGFDGSTSSYRQNLLNGNNGLLIQADGATLLRSISIISDANIAELRTLRVGGMQAAPIPEPGTLWSMSLAGFALWGVQGLRRRSARKGAGAPSFQS